MATKAWKWRPHGDNYPETFLEDEEGNVVLAIYESHGGGQMPEGENKALITAAPDLRDALRDAQALLGSHPETVTAEDRRATLDRIDAALKKARD